MGDVYRGRDLESGDLVAIKVLRPEVIAADPGVVALFHVDQEQGERALELYGLASRYPYVSCSRWYEDVAGRQPRRGRGGAAAGCDRRGAGTGTSAGPGGHAEGPAGRVE